MVRINNYTKLFARPIGEDGKVIKTICRRCWKPLPKGRTSFCCKDCAELSLIETNPHSYDHLVYKRLGSKCFLCGTDKFKRQYYGGGIQAELEVHHIMHIQHGGDNKLDNLCVLCHDCHVRVHKLCRMVEKILNEKQGSLSL